MSEYWRTNLADGSTIGEPGPVPADLLGLSDTSLADLSWADPALGYQGQGFLPVNRTVSGLAFKQRLTAQERIGIRSSTDPVIVDFLDLLSSANLVDLDNEDTVNGVHYLVSKDLLTSERAAQILE